MSLQKPRNRDTLYLKINVFFKLMEKMLEIGKSTKGLKKVISTKAKKAGLDHHLKVQLAK